MRHYFVLFALHSLFFVPFSVKGTSSCLGIVQLSAPFSVYTNTPYQLSDLLANITADNAYFYDSSVQQSPYIPIDGVDYKGKENQVTLNKDGYYWLTKSTKKQGTFNDWSA